MKALLIVASYLVIVGLTSGYIYQVTYAGVTIDKNPDKSFASIFGGVFWPIGLPILVGMKVFEPGPKYETVNSCSVPDACYRGVKP